MSIREQRYCALVTFDVCNVFNSLRCHLLIFAELRARGILAYLVRVLGSYFKWRKIRFHAEGRWRTRRVYIGVPRESMIGPLLWNLIYDSLLRLPLPRSCRFVGFVMTMMTWQEVKRLVEVHEHTGDLDGGLWVAFGEGED